VRTNFENTKDKKFPHCLVVGLARAPRRVTKRFLKKMEDRRSALETAKPSRKDKNQQHVVKNATEQLNRLKRLGVFIKTYNMSHLLATRYLYLYFV